MQPTNDELITNAFRLLSEIVRDFYSRRRRGCLGAPLKLQLRHRSYHTFSEQQLGFFKFSDFLRAAQQAGVIRVVPTPGGDVEVFPAGVVEQQGSLPYVKSAITPPDAETSTIRQRLQSGLALADDVVPPVHRERPLRVRPDLWNAFTSLAPASWAYDVANDIAFRLAESMNGGPLPAGLVAIPAARPRMVGWMVAFADRQVDTVRADLKTVLDTESGPYHFTKLVARDPNLHRAWRRYHIDQVVSEIQTWATSNGVRPKDITTSLGQMQRPASIERARSETDSGSSAASVHLRNRDSSSVLNDRVLELIDELVDELLRLRGTLQFGKRAR